MKHQISFARGGTKLGMIEEHCLIFSHTGIYPSVMRIQIEPYSYRTDPTVHYFPDDQPLIVFDGVCILCSWSVQFVLRHDRRQTFRFIIGQSPILKSRILG